MELYENMRCPECYHLQRKLNEMESKHHRDYVILKKQIIAKSNVISKFKIVTAQNQQLKEQINNLKDLIQNLQTDCQKSENGLAKNLKMMAPLKEENERLKLDVHNLQVKNDDVSREGRASQKLIEQLEVCIRNLKTEMKEEVEQAKRVKDLQSASMDAWNKEISPSSSVTELLLKYVAMSSSILKKNRLLKRASPLSRLLLKVQRGVQQYTSEPSVDDELSTPLEAESAGSRIENLLLDNDCGVEETTSCAQVSPRADNEITLANDEKNNSVMHTNGFNVEDTTLLDDEKQAMINSPHEGELSVDDELNMPLEAEPAGSRIENLLLGNDSCVEEITFCARVPPSADNDIKLTNDEKSNSVMHSNDLNVGSTTLLDHEKQAMINSPHEGEPFADDELNTPFEAESAESSIKNVLMDNDCGSCAVEQIEISPNSNLSQQKKHFDKSSSSKMSPDSKPSKGNKICHDSFGTVFFGVEEIASWTQVPPSADNDIKLTNDKKSNSVMHSSDLSVGDAISLDNEKQAGIKSSHEGEPFVDDELNTPFEAESAGSRIKNLLLDDNDCGSCAFEQTKISPTSNLSRQKRHFDKSSSSKMSPEGKSSMKNNICDDSVEGIFFGVEEIASCAQMPPSADNDIKLTNDKKSNSVIHSSDLNIGDTISLDNKKQAGIKSPYEGNTDHTYALKIAPVSETGTSSKLEENTCTTSKNKRSCPKEQSLFDVTLKRRKKSIKAASWYSDLPSKNSKPNQKHLSSKSKNKSNTVEKILEIMKLPERYCRPVSPILDIDLCPIDKECPSNQRNGVEAEQNNDRPTLCDISDKTLFGFSSEDESELPVQSSQVISRQSSSGFDISSFDG